jgi:hypothetical protein
MFRFALELWTVICPLFLSTTLFNDRKFALLPVVARLVGWISERQQQRKSLSKEEKDETDQQK